MTETENYRGILYPTRLPTFHRVPAPTELASLIRWLWIPRWNIAPGRTSRQDLLPFPASNLVVEPEGVTLSGPATRASHRDLHGTGWAVGALLRPAAIAALHPNPADLRDSETRMELPELQHAVQQAMSHPDEEVARLAAVTAFTDWAHNNLPAPDEAAVLANVMEDLIASERSILRVDQLAERLGTSTRAVQRLALRYVGVAPLAISRRYRLQEAAQRVRDEPSATISEVAAELGYADHAHLNADFRRVLGSTPNAYRRGAGEKE